MCPASVPAKIPIEKYWLPIKLQSPWRLTERWDQMTFNAKSNTPIPYVTEKDLTPPHTQSSVAYDSWGKDAKIQMKWKESAQRLKKKQKTWQQCVYLLSFDREQFAWLYTMAWASNQTQSTMFCLANINHSMREIYEMYSISDAWTEKTHIGILNRNLLILALAL